MENAGDDPFASLIIPYCKPTSSQEEKLQDCPFARESEEVPGNTQSSSATDEASEQATGIIMVSLPDSSDDYQTPPEQHSHSQNSSTDGQVPPTKIEAFDRKVKEGNTGDGEALPVDDACEQEGQRTVDLSKDSDNLGFSEKTHTVPVEDNDAIIIDNIDTDPIDTANGVIETEPEIENGITDTLPELTNLPTDKTHKVFDEMPLREQEETTSANKYPKRNIDDIDKFRYVGTKGKRELPFSLKEQDKSSKRDDDYAKHKALMDVLDHALKLLVGEVKGANGDNDDEVNGDFDFLETARKRGMAFPRPRWWPREGFED